MEKFWSVLSVCLILGTIGVSSAPATTIDLQYWGFNVGGDVYKGGDEWGNDALPSFFDDSAFDWDTGIGEITLEFDPGAPGNYSVLSYFDHEIDEIENTFFNEYGEAVGTPAAGQTWEIDEGGHMFGDIADHLLNGGPYDNTNSIDSQHPEDVSMGMGWDFLLEAGEKAMISFLVGEVIPQGFYLAQTDPDSQKTIYFSTTIGISGGGDVPEPGTMVLMSAGLLGLFGLRKRISGT